MCASIDVTEALRTLAVTPGQPQEQVIAYFLPFSVTQDELARYANLGIALQAQTDCTLAPSMTDAYQNLGSRLLQHLLGIARRLGRQRMVLLGGTQATNDRAIHFYRNTAFKRLAHLRSRTA